MELIGTKITDVTEGVKRITGYVKYNDGYIDEYWYEFPAHFEISNNGNPWLAALLPMAATINEDLVISLPVDQRLLDGANNIQKFWSDWNKGTSIINIKADNIAKVSRILPENAVSFFSSGVDAFFTAYNKPRAKYKILIHGFDLSITKLEEFKVHSNRISKVVDELGQKIIIVKTNLRQTRWQKTRWQAISHGAALASIALLFEPYFSEVFIPSSVSRYTYLECWGSHPVTDPLFSTSTMNFIDDGDGLNRFDKIKLLANYNLALKNLHVCIRGKDGKGQDEINCSHCEKCYRTMIALDLSGCLDKCVLFDKEKYNYSEIPYIFINDVYDNPEYEPMAKEALRQNKPELAEAIYKAIKRSKLLIRLKPLEKLPYIWRIPFQMLKNSIY
ncbi:MAG: hypothetical protein H6912_10665 [Kordiimonadaceae bacterium]|nr:hypothetical protein [Kordiimonadaceae bacterium]